MNTLFDSSNAQKVFPADWLAGSWRLDQLIMSESVVKAKDLAAQLRQAKTKATGQAADLLEQQAARIAALEKGAVLAAERVADIIQMARQKWQGEWTYTCRGRPRRSAGGGSRGLRACRGR